MEIRYVGDNPRVLFGKFIIPGETREVSEGQWAWLQREWPDQFEGPEAEVETEPEPEEEAAKKKPRKRRKAKPETLVEITEKPEVEDGGDAGDAEGATGE